jgi:hypothetical protein
LWGFLFEIDEVEIAVHEADDLERDPVKLKRIRHWRGNWRIPVR